MYFFDGIAQKSIARCCKRIGQEQSDIKRYELRNKQKNPFKETPALIFNPPPYTARVW